MRPSEEIRKGNVNGLDVAIKAEDSQTSFGSSSSRNKGRNSLSLSSSSSSQYSNIRSSSTQYSDNHSSSSDMAARVDYSSTGAHRHIINIGVIHGCVIDVEG